MSETLFARGLRQRHELEHRVNELLVENMDLRQTKEKLAHNLDAVLRENARLRERLTEADREIEIWWQRFAGGEGA